LVADEGEACDLIGWPELGRVLNPTWGMACSDAEWLTARDPKPPRRP
jgi:hypothetical protein